MKDNKIYLSHILESIENIEEYSNGLDFESFSNDKKTISAVVRELEIIGEASNNLSDGFKNNHPDFPWRNAIDMRNVLAHEYFGVNKKVVWDTVKNNLPNLKRMVKNIS